MQSRNTDEKAGGKVKVQLWRCWKVTLKWSVRLRTSVSRIQTVVLSTT